MQKVAFFDIDGTIFRSSLLIELVDKFVEEEIFPPNASLGYQEEFEDWRDREGTYEAYIGAVIKTFLSNIQGVHYGALADIGRAIVAKKSKHVYRYTRDLLKELKDEGYYTIAISQSPKTILDDFCRQYGFDKVYGRMYEIGPQDRFTGEVIEEHLIANKANIAKRVFQRHPELTSEGSVGVGDTEGDIPLLENVSRPICFNPNRALYDYAKQMNWSVVVERKNVIYHL
jgi:HAD superfamily hydrolase (TIGR01490 family)